jgi:anionic cell wall polymer biosynthesis LytR-Cps2A-Psr (LCP) family protein
VTFDPLGHHAPAGRRAARRAEQRRRRRRNQRVFGAVAGLLMVVAAVAVVFGGPGEEKKDVGDKRTQRTLLLQVQGPDRTAVATALLAHDPATKEGAVVLVPPQVIATVPGAGSQLLGKALSTSGIDGSRNALADLVGVTIDGSWVLDAAAFQRLVSAEGGIDVTVDVPIVQGRTIVLQAGEQHVDGVRAYAFATYLAPGEQEQSRLARLQSVIDGVLTGLPDKVDALVGSLGATSRHTQKVGDVAAVLSGLKADGRRDALQYRSLPVIKVDAGTDETRFRLDDAASRLMVDELLADSVPEGARAEGNRVLVLNGVGTPGLGAKVRDKLVRNGLVFVGSRNAPSFGYAKTVVLVKDATQEGAALGARVARAIGLPAASVQVSDQIGTITDVVIIVGADFKP